MKKLFTFIFIAFTMSSFAQLRVMEKSEEPQKIGKVNGISCSKLGDEYTFIYSDLKFRQINEYKSFSFKDTDNAFENLYTIIIDGLKTIPKEDIKIELPDAIISLHFVKTMGVQMSNLCTFLKVLTSGDILFTSQRKK